jgi:hypothetical protein
MSAPVDFTPTGPPETVLDAEPAEVRQALEAALTVGDRAQRRAAVATVVTRWPRSLEGWACMGELARDAVEAYAYYRVGYHRGLDHLRHAGWRGSGYVRWHHDSNRGFLRCLDGLRAAAMGLGERDEEERCAEFLRQLDPDWDHGH